MTRSSKVQNDRLRQLEADFEPLLLSCLRETANGRYGLFGQNEHLDPEHKYSKWSEAQKLVGMAEEIQSLRSEFGESNALAKRLLELRSLRGSNVPGEPKLAKRFLEDVKAG